MQRRQERPAAPAWNFNQERLENNQEKGEAPYPVGPPIKMPYPCQEQKRHREEREHETEENVKGPPAGGGKDPSSCCVSQLDVSSGHISFFSFDIVMSKEPPRM